MYVLVIDENELNDKNDAAPHTQTLSHCLALNDKNVLHALSVS